MTLHTLTFKDTDDNKIMSLINEINKGISFKSFKDFSKRTSFTLGEWSKYLHLSERSIQRYEKENKSFETLQSQQIMQIAMLFNRGQEIFGDQEKFKQWLGFESLALGQVKPKDLLTNGFGIGLINDELTRIEHGVLA